MEKCYAAGTPEMFAVPDAAEVEVRAVADVATVLIGPADEAVVAVVAVVAVFWFNDGRSGRLILVLQCFN